MPYREQVILARSHLTLARITGVLEQLGVPLLYLGDLFERNEIRDLLSLVALDAEYRRHWPRPRRGACPNIRCPGNDALTRDPLGARPTRLDLRRAEPHFGDRRPERAGRAGLASLASQLDGLSNASPWTLLTTWLFERSDYLRPLLVGNDVVSQQQLVAIYQLLKVCGEQAAIGDIKPQATFSTACAGSKR